MHRNICSGTCMQVMVGCAWQELKVRGNTLENSRSFSWVHPMAKTTTFPLQDLVEKMYDYKLKCCRWQFFFGPLPKVNVRQMKHCNSKLDLSFMDLLISLFVSFHEKITDGPSFWESRVWGFRGKLWSQRRWWLYLQRSCFPPQIFYYLSLNQ